MVARVAEVGWCEGVRSGGEDRTLSANWEPPAAAREILLEAPGGTERHSRARHDSVHTGIEWNAAVMISAKHELRRLISVLRRRGRGATLGII